MVHFPALNIKLKVLYTILSQWDHEKIEVRMESWYSIMVLADHFVPYSNPPAHLYILSAYNH